MERGNKIRIIIHIIIISTVNSHYRDTLKKITETHQLLQQDFDHFANVFATFPIFLYLFHFVLINVTRNMVMLLPNMLHF